MLRNASQYLWHYRSAFRRGAVTATLAPALTIPPVTTAAAQRASTPARVLTLENVLDSALSRHPLALAARARVRAAEGARTTARAFGNPVLNYDVENAPFPNGDPVRGMERESMATAMLPLESIFQRGPRARRANADVRAAEADADLTRQQLALEAARAYFRTAFAQVSVDAARDLTAWLDSVVAYNRVRVEQGVAAEADLIRAELERDRAAANATLQEAERVRARAQLASFLGDGLRQTDDLMVAVDDSPLAMPAFADALQAAPIRSQVPGTPVARSTGQPADVIRRSDIRAARERLTAAGFGVSSERSMIVREFGATFGAKWSAGTTSMVAGLSIPFPVFDPNRGGIARATAERDVAAQELAAQERTAHAELAGAYDAALLLTERATMLARGSEGRPPFLTRADEARRIALGAYREGAASLLQVIDAARAWNEARVAYYEMLYAQQESIATLIVAHGDDLLTDLPPLAASGGRGPR